MGVDIVWSPEDPHKCKLPATTAKKPTEYGIRNYTRIWVHKPGTIGSCSDCGKHWWVDEEGDWCPVRWYHMTMKRRIADGR